MKFKDPSMCQIVIDPNGDERYQLDAFVYGRQYARHVHYTRWQLLRARFLRMLHPWVHHFVVWLDFEPNSKRIRPVGMVCAYCGYGMLG